MDCVVGVVHRQQHNASTRTASSETGILDALNLDFLFQYDDFRGLERHIEGELPLPLRIVARQLLFKDEVAHVALVHAGQGDLLAVIQQRRKAVLLAGIIAPVGVEAVAVQILRFHRHHVGVHGNIMDGQLLAALQREDRLAVCHRQGLGLRTVRRIPRRRVFAVQLHAVLLTAQPQGKRKVLVCEFLRAVAIQHLFDAQVCGFTGVHRLMGVGRRAVVLDGPLLGAQAVCPIHLREIALRTIVVFRNDVGRAHQ